MKQYILFALLSAASLHAMDDRKSQEDDSPFKIKKNNAFTKSESEQMEEFLKLGIGLSNNSVLIYCKNGTTIIVYNPHGRRGDSWKCSQNNEGHKAYYQNSMGNKKEFSKLDSSQLYALFLNYYKNKFNSPEFQKQLAHYLNS